MTDAPPKVFISYSHDSIEHQQRVLGFADRLRTDGIDAEIDQYNTAPPVGWPLWCERQIAAADFVLMVCTETYYRRVSGDEERGKGLGVVWETRIIRQLLYDAGAGNDKFVPVLFSDASPEQIPTPIKGGTRYVIDTKDGYEDLYRRLTGQPRLLRPALGTIRPLPTRRPQWPEGTMGAEQERVLDHFLSYPVKFIQDLFALITGPKGFIDERSKAKTMKIGPALGFLATTKLVSWSIPPYAETKNTIEFVAKNTAFLFEEVLIFMAILLLAWRIVGGKATFLAYLPIYLYYNAISGLLTEGGNKMFLGILRMSDQQLYQDFVNSAINGNIAFFVKNHDRMAASIGPWIWFIFDVLYFTAFLVWIVAGWGAYRRLNNTSRRRSTIAALLFLILCVPANAVLGISASAFSS